MDISYTVPEDAGVYTVVATNEQGQDQVDGQLNVETKSGLRCNFNKTFRKKKYGKYML